MATRIFSLNPGEEAAEVNEAVGPTATSGIISVVVDLASNLTDQGSTRGPDLSEVINALENLKEHMLRINKWPPA